MEVEQHLDTLNIEARKIMMDLHQMIQANDTAVEASVEPLMSVKAAIVYKENGVFKYGLTVNKNHLSYHSMVMYVYPKLTADLKTSSPKIKWRKGCFNFKKMEDLDLVAFVSFLKNSAHADFSPVIDHYQKKKKVDIT